LTTTTPKPLRRSELHQRVFPDELMMQAFGTLSPTVKQRTAYFFEKYMEWRQHRIRIKHGRMPQVKKLLRDSGLMDMWEYQVMHNEVRFSQADHMAWFRLSTDVDQYIVPTGSVTE